MHLLLLAQHYLQDLLVLLVVHLLRQLVLRQRLYLQTQVVPARTLAATPSVEARAAAASASSSLAPAAASASPAAAVGLMLLLGTYCGLALRLAALQRVGFFLRPFHSGQRPAFPGRRAIFGRYDWRRNTGVHRCDSRGHGRVNAIDRGRRSEPCVASARRCCCPQ